MSAGCSSQKLPLWADFSFLNSRAFPDSNLSVLLDKLPEELPSASSNPAEFAQPQKTVIPSEEGTNLGVFVPTWPVSSHTNAMAGRIGNKHAQICTLSAGDDRPLTLLKRAVQIRVGLELADTKLRITPLFIHHLCVGNGRNTVSSVLFLIREQDFYQTYAHTKVERGFFPALFCPKRRKINRKCPEIAPFFRAKARLAQLW